MKKLMMTLAGLAFAVTAYAADQENKESATVDHSKNPITGTKTTTKKWNKKVKDGKGTSDAAVTEKTKVKTDGTVEKSTETEVNSDSGH
ncbi:MAG: hypothetical protein KF799_09635 [Bdellovibrionales bacterium]|nr:hypothetical protein [Bdellovibrionales bacterium]